MNEETSREALERMTKDLIANQEVLEVSMKPLAQLTKARLDALVGAGFTRGEALDIIKARGLQP